jgi:hypothetical protein
MPSRATPLNKYPAIRSTEPELVRDRLISVFGATRFEPAKEHSGFAARTNHLKMPGLGLSYCAYASAVTIGFGEASFVRQIFNIEGAARYSFGSTTEEIAPGTGPPILPAQTPLNFTFKSHYRHLVLRIEFDALLRNLSALLGQDLTKKLVFDETGICNPATSALRRRIFPFAADFNERGSFFSDLAAAEVERMVIMNFLMCHRHNYTHLLLREPLPTSRSSAKVVEEFIEAN